MRTVARETLFKFIFAAQFADSPDEDLKKLLFKAAELTADDIAYGERVLSILDEHREDFLKILDQNSVSFPEKRIFPSDRAVLLIGLAEIVYMDDIPVKVTLNECANIASKYSSAKSASFITGILSTVARESSGGNNV